MRVSFGRSLRREGREEGTRCDGINRTGSFKVPEGVR